MTEVLDTSYAMTINGNAVPSHSTIAVINPATGEEIDRAPDCSEAQLDEAIEAARAAFPAWRDTSAYARGAAMKQAASVLLAHRDELMRLFTREQGKAHIDALREIERSAMWLNEVADMDIPIEVNEDQPDRRSETHHVPIGVVAGISPWNFPVMLSFWKIAPCLKAGNTLVLKPSPFTPLTMLRIGELLRDSFPPGVLNIITGGDALGPLLTAHPGIDKVSFTGSTATGKRVMAAAAADLKRITLELGGNDAAIVLPDVDVDAVAPEIFWTAFRNNGQLCVAAKRIYIHSSTYDALAAAIVAYARTVKTGNGADEGVALGPVQNRLQFERVAEIIEDCRAQGFKFLIGGDIDRHQPGFFIPVTIVDNPPDDSRIVNEEPFGPVVPLLKYETEDEAILRANASEFGLAGSVWSSDTDHAYRVASKLETGTVWINEAHYLVPHQPFAGHKMSGFGVENGLSGLLEYTVPKTITMRKR